MADIDIVNRDPNNLNQHIKAQFEDVFGEPDGTHSCDCVWVSSYKCFNGAKNCCYSFITFFCGVWVAIYWGCDFAITTFDHVWCVTPLLRTCAITCGSYQKLWGTCITCCVTPVCEAFGQYWSNMKITMTKS